MCQAACFSPSRRRSGLRRGVARNRMRTEAGKMPESLVFPIRNGLGVSNDRFGIITEATLIERIPTESLRIENDFSIRPVQAYIVQMSVHRTIPKISGLQPSIPRCRSRSSDEAHNSLACSPTNPASVFQPPFPVPSTAGRQPTGPAPGKILPAVD